MEALRSGENIEEAYDLHLRAYNNVTTWLAEGLNGSMRTPFEYFFNGQELLSEDGQNLAEFFTEGINEARQLAIDNPMLAFEERRRVIEADELEDMLKMARKELPNAMIVVSDFPEELMDAADDLGGYNVTRKQTMLRVVVWTGETIKLYSQSLDGSNRQALEAIYADLGFMPQPGELLAQRMHLNALDSELPFVIDHSMNIYDAELEAQTGYKHHAGQKLLTSRQTIDTYNFACAQTDLVERAIGQVLIGTFDNKAMYETIATVNERYEDACRGVAIATPAIYRANRQLVEGEFNHLLELEIKQAASHARLEGKVFSGCGFTVGPISGAAAVEQLGEAGYGSKSTEDKYGSRTFTCPNGHFNKRPYNKLLKSCQHVGCKAAVACI
jgi:hypothetical protein